MPLPQHALVALWGGARRTIPPRSTLSQLRPVLKPGIVVVLAVSIGYALASGWNDLKQVDWRFEPVPLGVAFVSLFIQVCLVAPLWVMLCRGLGGAIPMRLGIRAHLLANLGKYLPGKVLHAVALVAMAREAGVASAVGVTSILLEVLLTVIGAGLVALFGLAVTMSDQRWAITSLAVVSLGAALVILHPRVLSFVLAAAARFVPAARGRLERVELPYATMLTLLGLYVASWALVALGLFATAAAVHPLAPELFVGLTGITAFGYLVGLAVPFAPAGVGAREGTTAFLLSTVLGVPLPAAAAVSVLARFIAILAEMTAALVASRL